MLKQTIRKITFALSVLLFIALAWGLKTASASAATPYKASYQIGQTNFTTRDHSASSTTLYQPQGSALDTVNHRLWVADGSNNRVVMYNLNSKNLPTDSTIDYILGQSIDNASQCNQGGGSPTADTLCNPWGVALDTAHHHLYVSDYDNSRELIYNLGSTNLPLDATADYVIGQNVDFNIGHCNENITPTPYTLCHPAPPTLDLVNHHLFIPDYGNNRVLMYDLTVNNIPDDIDTNAGADMVLGQADGESGSCDYDNEGDTSSAIDLCAPYSVTLDLVQNHLWVADNDNSRVIIYNTDGTGTALDGTADSVYGQTSFATGGSCTGTYNSTSLTATDYCHPDDVVLDTARHQLFLNDEYNLRVLVYNLNTSNLPTSTTPNGLLGASSFTADANTTCDSDGSTTQHSLCYADGPSFDSANHRLFYTDRDNHRVVIFDFAKIDTKNLANATRGRKYSKTIAVSGTQGVKRFSISSGSLPQGLSLSSTSGQISGKPTRKGAHSFTVKITDKNGVAGNYSDTKRLSISVK